MENLLENYGEALKLPPISVESDEPNDADIIQAIPNRSHYHRRRTISSVCRDQQGSV